MSNELPEDPRLKFFAIPKTQKAEEKRDILESKILRRILTYVELDNEVIKHLDEQGKLTFAEVQYYNLNLPVRLVSFHRYKMELLKLLLKLPATPVWLDYFTARASVPFKDAAHVGIVFCVNGGAMWVAHDWPGEQPAGYTRITRTSDDGEHTIVIEPFEAFLTYL